MRKAWIAALLFLCSSLLLAQQVDIPVTNWTVPPYAAPAGGLRPMVDVTGPRAFIPVVPCRVIDTRRPAGPYGGPALPTNVARAFNIPGGPCPGIPTVFVNAWSLSIGAILPPADGFLSAWQHGAAQPVVSQLNFLAGEVVANAAIVPNGDNDSIDVLVNVGPTHVYIDINGYFSPIWTAFDSFSLNNTSSSSPTAFFINNSTGCILSGCTVWAVSHSNTNGRTIYGDLPSGGFDSAAIEGHHGGFFTIPGYTAAGVRGEGPDTGVLGIGKVQGVAGSLLNASGAELVYGILGFSAGSDPPGAPPWSFFGNGSVGATGTKSFLDPHPTDPTREIVYISLEGPEAGTYFRGRGRFQNGVARIPVPEHFRLVTDPEGLTVQITPIGAMASVGVLRMDLNEIVVQASRNVEFSYLVQGVRANFKDQPPMRGSAEFTPRSADAKIPEWLSPGQKRALIQNGTYRPDGTVNTETARRLGWDRLWAERERNPVAEPSTP